MKVELSARDWAVIDQLKKMGDPLTQPRHTLLFFYRRKDQVSDTPDFDAIVRAGSERGLTVAGRDIEGVILEGQMKVDPISIAPVLDWAAGLAGDARAKFDGWECAVLLPPN